MSTAIPEAEPLITIEDSLELCLDWDEAAHPDVVAMQSREPNTEGEGEITLAELVRWALRMTPDRVVVGEVRGAEVIPMLNAMSQGNDGSMTTIHASSSRGAFTKLAAYECGIQATGDAQGRFSVRFYLVAVLFILFDVEMVFMMPWAVIYRQLPHITGSRLFGFWEMLVYLGFVAVGLYYIVRKGILNWSHDRADL